MTAVAWSGMSTVLERRLFSVLLAERKKCRQSILLKASVFRGMDFTRLMMSRLLMMRGNLCSLVSELAGIMIAAITNTLSGMRKGK